MNVALPTIMVLLAEDSAASRVLLVHLLERDPRIRVLGVVNDGRGAVDFVQAQKPDVILMDMHMPLLGGLEATRLIMQICPVPIVICSAVSDVLDTKVTFRALEAGAVACVDKPFATAEAGFADKVAHMIETIKLMSEVKVVRRRARPVLRPPRSVAPPLRRSPPVRAKCIGIGASTGGPPVLRTILAALPKDFAAPILVVQHISAGFLPGMAAWLSESSGLPVHIGTHGTLPLPGHVYLAPDHFHMGVGTGGLLILSSDAPENHVRPAVSFLFRSLCEIHADDAVGVLLTGMGQDGAAELGRMRERGAMTIAQDQESSAVFGMPAAAIALGAAVQVLPPERIGDALIVLASSPSPLTGSNDHTRP